MGVVSLGFQVANLSFAVGGFCTVQYVLGLVRKNAGLGCLTPKLAHWTMWVYKFTM